MRKVKGTLHWVSIAHAVAAEARLYDRLFTVPEPDRQEDSFLNYINPESLKVVTAYVEPSLTTAKAGETLQFQRLGYFCVDPDSTAEKLVFNKTVGLKDTWEKIKSE
jgi:glutamine--tRNA ligase